MRHKGYMNVRIPSQRKWQPDGIKPLHEPKLIWFDVNKSQWNASPCIFCKNILDTNTNIYFRIKFLTAGDIFFWTKESNRNAMNSQTCSQLPASLATLKPALFGTHLYSGMKTDKSNYYRSGKHAERRRKSCSWLHWSTQHVCGH